MTEWWESLSMLVRVLYCIAVPSTLILLLQTIFSIAGIGDDADINLSDTGGIDMGTDIDVDVNIDVDTDVDFGVDTDIDTDIDGDICPDGDVDSVTHVHGNFASLRLFTLQGIVAFLAVFGWVSIAGVSMGMPSVGAIVLGFVAGFFAMYGVAKLVQISSKLSENGTIDFRNAIGETAAVYIPIPPNGEGEGKVTLTLQGRFMECNAVSNEKELLKTGTVVRVTDLNGKTLVVERND
ncbi:MAG: hypothetical protein K2K44_02980 [Oscillospiraceae bacterium]|nr:hypothetical protein [Oscillospiraceae bacterium]